MNPLDLPNLYIMDIKGNRVKLSEITDINFDNVPDNPGEDILYVGLEMCLNSSITFNLKPSPHNKGLFDSIAKPYTSAACRYRRWAKRKKEKERRRKLKDGKSSMP